MKFRIRSESNGTYFKCMTVIGPAFGASWDDAATFADGWSAYHTIGAMPAVVSAEMVNERGEACTVTGDPLPAAPRRETWA